MNNISLVIGREYRTRVRKKAFIVTTILMPVLLVAMMVVPALIAMYSGGDQRVIAVYDGSGEILSKLENTKLVRYEQSNAAYPEIQKQNPSASGYLIIPENIAQNGAVLELYMNGTSAFELEQNITQNVEKIIERQRIQTSNIPGLDSIMRSVTANVSINTFKVGETQTKDQGEKAEQQTSSVVSMAVGYASGILIYMFVLIYGVMVMQGVIEEKSSRIIEVMVSSVKPFQLMMGKIVGIALVALTQVAIWIVLVGVGWSVVSGMIAPEVAAQGAQIGAQGVVEAQTLPQGGLSAALSILADPWYILGIVGAFILYFVGGYLLYASMYAAVGSAVDAGEDSQQLQTPLTIPLIISFFIMMSVMKDPTGDLAFWTSMIPLSSPVVMMARIPYGVPGWEVFLSLLILYGSFVGMTWVAAKVYRVGIFTHGKRPSFMEIIRWTRYRS